MSYDLDQAISPIGKDLGDSRALTVRFNSAVLDNTRRTSQQHQRPMGMEGESQSPC